MKPTIDTIQILLQTPGLQYPATVVLIWLLLSVIKTIFAVIRQTRIIAGAMFYKITLWRLVVIIFISIFVVQNVEYLTDALQYAETRTAGIQAGQYAGYSSDHLTAIYEEELKKHTDPYEFKVIKDSVTSWVLEFGCDSSAIYECAYPECGLDPFAIHKDGCAAGFIQFTISGLNGSGKSLDYVKQVCKDRNIIEMMRLTGWYFRDRAKGRKLQKGIDIYLLVFCPKFVGCQPEQVLYNSGSSYSMNRNLDGWGIENGKIVRSPQYINGDITANELNLWLESKKGKLIKSHQKNGY